MPSQYFELIQMKKTIIIPFIAAGFVSHASAADFQYVTESESTVFQIDFDSIANVQKYKKAWLISHYYETQETRFHPKRQYRSTKTLWYFDCNAKLSGPFNSTLYDGEYAAGKVVASEPVKFNPQLLDDVAPDTVGETMLSTVCGSPANRAKIKERNAATMAAILEEIRKAKLKE